MDRIIMQNILLELSTACNAVSLKVNADALLEASVRIYNTEVINNSHNSGTRELLKPIANKEIADFPATEKQKAFAKSLKIDFPATTISKNELSALIHAKIGD